MKKRTLMKKICVFAMLCVLTMTMFLEPSFAGTYKVNDGGIETVASIPRSDACDKMTIMSQMTWTLPETLYYCTLQSGGALTKASEVKLYKYKDGKSANGVITRKGIPYSQVDREYSFPSGTFTLNFGNKTLIDDGITYRSVHGTDCASSVAFAWRKGTGNNSASSNFLKRTNTNHAIYTTENMFNDAVRESTDTYTGDFLKVVGDYGKYNKKTAANTRNVVDALSAAGNYGAGKDIYSEVYAKIKPGDALLFRGSSGHVRLVTGVHIVYTDTAKTQVDPEASYVNCIEQTGFRKYKKDADATEKKIASNWSTSWIPNEETVQEGTYAGQKKFTGMYTFNQLTGKTPSPTVNGGDSYNRYIPIRLNVWS
ncbi:MAG: hypothetical protein ACLRJC_06305 [Emergencia timonensis]|uniref:hypothetical protein n=1 Tax=Emergencia timonensis TaxID=1776384 RepID=UPI0008332334|nr:hypothetical protein [Emergencia timonensis]WNX88211.1 hypothetical protein RVY71_18690 [Emergencia timonensis]